MCRVKLTLPQKRGKQASQEGDEGLPPQSRFKAGKRLVPQFTGKYLELWGEGDDYYSLRHAPFKIVYGCVAITNAVRWGGEVSPAWFD